MSEKARPAGIHERLRLAPPNLADSAPFPQLQAQIPREEQNPKSSIDKGISAGDGSDTASDTSWTPLKITRVIHGRLMN
jgi:hypothetical protein